LRASKKPRTHAGKGRVEGTALAAKDLLFRRSLAIQNEKSAADFSQEKGGGRASTFFLFWGGGGVGDFPRIAIKEGAERDVRSRSRASSGDEAPFYERGNLPLCLIF